MTILPITYLGGTGWYGRVLDGSAGSPSGGCVLDLGENWVKQTARNRCEILTSGGVAALTVPVHASRPDGGAACLTRDVRIDHSKRWAHVHWQSIVSAYRRAPYFEHYAGRFEPVFVARRHEFLVDLDLELLEIVLGILRLPPPKISTEYVAAAPDDLDLRGKKRLRAAANRANATLFPPAREYTQVFSDRHPFAPGLSIIDLIFNEGPDAHNFLV